MDYAIDVQKLPARLVDRSGRETSAQFFLHAMGAHLHAPETIGGRLNADISFVPCEVDGAVELFSLARLAYAEFAEPLPEVEELRQVGVAGVAVELELVHDEIVEGELMSAAPAQSHRASDLLNSGSQRFLLLVSGDNIRYVNRSAIRRARPKD